MRTGRRARAAAVVLVVVGSAVLVLPGLALATRAAALVLAQLLLLLLATGVCGLQALRSQGDHRRTSLYLAAACTCAFSATVGIVIVGVTTGDRPDVPSLVDVALLLYCGLSLAALVSVPVRRDVGSSRLLAGLDGLVAAACLLFVALAVVLPAVAVRTDLSMTGRVVAAAHPILDGLVAATALGMLGLAPRRSRGFLGAVAAAFAVAGATNAVFMVQVARGEDIFSSPAGVGLLVVTALLVQAGSVLPTGQGSADDEREIGVAWAVHVPVLLAISTAALWTVTSRVTSPALSLSALAVAVTLGIRGLVSARDNGRLARHLRLALARVQFEQEHFLALVSNSSDTTTLLDRHGVITWQSAAVEDLLGHRPGELVGVDVRKLIHPEDLPPALAHLAGGGPASAPVKVEHRARRSDGSWVWVETTVQDELQNPHVGAVVLHTRDVHDRHLLEQRLLHQAYLDPVTGLPNRYRLHEAIAAALPPAQQPPPAAAPEAHRPSAALLLLDLDAFKAVNDSLGHAAGDEVLVHVAARMRTCLRQDDLVARLGGDEFAVLIFRTEQDIAAQAQSVAARLLEAIAAPITLADRPVVVGASIGISELTATSSVGEVLRNADLAMYSAKAAGKGRAALFTPSLHARAVEHLELTGALRLALQRRELSVAYQPIHATGGARALSGAEALVRWTHPTLGPVPPDRFVSLAEDSGLIDQLGHFVLDEACRQLASWQSEGLHLPVVTVNVSAQELRDGYADHVARVLFTRQVPAERLVVEVTESCLMSGAGSTRTLSDLRTMGVRVAIDDFGTGYSSLAQLRWLPADILKIDKAFVDEITLGASDVEGATGLLDVIVDFGHRVGLRVVAEGVEDSSQLARLSLMGCDYAQGYHFSPPVSADVMRLQLASRAAPRAGTPRTAFA